MLAFRRRRIVRCTSDLHLKHVSRSIANGRQYPYSDTNTLISNSQYILQKCARERSTTEGKACHAQIVRAGLQADTITSNMLINMYSKCGLVIYARKIFDAMPERSIVSWNTMIGSYAQNKEEENGLNLFIKMQREGTRSSEFTMSSVLCACAANCAITECKQLHAFALKIALDSNAFVATALVDVYAKCSLIKDAVQIFERLNEKCVVMWSSMVSGYVQNELYEEALVLFREAQRLGVEQSEFILSSVVCASASLAALIEGNQIHAVLHKTGFLSNIFVASSLIDMYSKCGMVEEAYTVFLDAEEKSVVLWNVLISGFSKHACCLEARISFEKMQQLGVYPNEVTYISVLSACSHVGLVEEGKKYFNLMIQEHNVSPNVFHYSCMVDILGRAGLIEEAYVLIHDMPFDATASMWGSVLRSCKNFGKVKLAEAAANHLFEIEPDNAGNHVLLSNIYAANKMWDKVIMARKVLKNAEVKKERGKSWIEVKSKVHTFLVGERKHPKIEQIYLKLEDLVREMKVVGYEAETIHDLHDVEESLKHKLLMHHSEKLALAYGLMCLPSSAPIRIMKNLTICGDCHSFMKIASKITDRTVIVRDTSRFHHFRNGNCSCGGFW